MGCVSNSDRARNRSLEPKPKTESGARTSAASSSSSNSFEAIPLDRRGRPWRGQFTYPERLDRQRRKPIGLEEAHYLFFRRIAHCPGAILDVPRRHEGSLALPDSRCSELRCGGTTLRILPETAEIGRGA